MSDIFSLNHRLEGEGSVRKNKKENNILNHIFQFGLEHRPLASLCDLQQPPPESHPVENVY